MKSIRTLFLAFAILFLNINSSHSKIWDDGFEENENYIEVIGIENIYAPKRLRKVLDYYSELDLSKKSNRDEIDRIQNIPGIKTAEEYLQIFKEKFIVTQITKMRRTEKEDGCGRGSFEFSITIRPKAMEGLLITITEDNKICEIWDADIKNTRYREEYLLQDYMDHWF